MQPLIKQAKGAKRLINVDESAVQPGFPQSPSSQAVECVLSAISLGSMRIHDTVPSAALLSEPNRRRKWTEIHRAVKVSEECAAPS